MGYLHPAASDYCNPDFSSFCLVGNLSSLEGGRMREEKKYPSIKPEIKGGLTVDSHQLP